MWPVYLWTQKPKSKEAALRKIARCLGTHPEGFADVNDSGGNSVRVRVAKVYRHLFKDHRGKNWYLVPLIKPSIERGKPFGPERRKGKKVERLYSSTIRAGIRGRKLKPHYVATYVEESERGRNWNTTFLVKTRDKLADKERAAGLPLSERNSHSNFTTRNPIPVQTPLGVLRSGRTPLAHSKYNSGETRKASFTWAILLALGLIIAGNLAEQEAA